MYEVVIRTIDGRRLLRPVPELTDGVNGVIGRALTLYPIELHAHTYLSNHGHLQLSSVGGDDVSTFVGYLNRNTAEVVKSVTGHRGPVWTRFRPIPILDDRASVRRLRYIISNSVKEGLVESPLDWPGPSSTRALVTGEPIEGDWIVRRPGHRRAQGKPERYRINLTPLPCWAELAPSERAARVQEIIDDVVAEGRRERDGRPVLGIERLLAQDPFEPTAIEETAPPVAHFSEATIFEEYREAQRQFRDAHRRASADHRDTPDSFPPFGFPARPTFRSGR